MFQDLALYQLFIRVIPSTVFGEQKSSQVQWEQIKKEASNFGMRVQEFLQEVEP